MQARTEELLPVSYFHVVFTLPEQLSLLALQNKRIIYHLLFRATSETLLEIAADPKHLGAKIGCFAVSSSPICVKRVTRASSLTPGSCHTWLKRKASTVCCVN